MFEVGSFFYKNNGTLCILLDAWEEKLDDDEKDEDPRWYLYKPILTTQKSCVNHVWMTENYTKAEDADVAQYIRDKLIKDDKNDGNRV